MSLTNAMLTGFTGIQSNSVGVDTVGDNLANLNTTAFKSQRTLFETLLYQTVHGGSGPDGASGGTLPIQFGTGSGVSSLQRNYRQGGLESTGFAADLAVEGDGFFIVNSSDGRQLFTRDGSFRLDSSQTLVSANGAPLQVFAADASGTITPGPLSDLVIPLGTASQAVATTQVIMDGRLDPATAIAATGAVVVSEPLVTASGSAATASTAMTDLVDGNGVPMFVTGDELRLNVSKGGIAMPESIFIVGTDGSTLGDLAERLQTVLAIDPNATATPAPGVTVSAGPQPSAGSLVFVSQPGDVHAVQLTSSSITNATGLAASPISFSTLTPATGEGVTTSFNVYDSLGQPVDVRIRATMEAKSDTGTTWRFYAESIGDSDLSPLLGTGTISFDANGQFVAATGSDITLDRAGTGATTPIAFNIDFGGLTGLASPDGSSELIMADQNGAPPGILTNYSIDRDGIVTGLYSNQQEEVLGQVAVATFINDEGLVAQGENNYAPGPNSGDPQIGAPQTGTAGAVVSGALEQSNVEIAREFINLISASTGISAASRVVRAADDLLQELLLLGR